MKKGILIILALVLVSVMTVAFTPRDDIDLRGFLNITNFKFMNGTDVELNGNLLINGSAVLTTAASGDITAVQGDNIYLYNGSNSGDVTLLFNETKLNATITSVSGGITTNTNTNVSAVTVTVGTSSGTNELNISQDGQEDISTTYNQYNLNVSADSGSDSIFDYAVFAINGAGSVSTALSGNTLTITGVDTDTIWVISNVYLYNNSGILTFNDTKLNSTIDARDTDTQLSEAQVEAMIFDNDNTGDLVTSGTLNASAYYFEPGIGENEISVTGGSMNIQAAGNIDLNAPTIYMSQANPIIDTFESTDSTITIQNGGTGNLNLSIEGEVAVNSNNVTGVDCILFNSGGKICSAP